MTTVDAIIWTQIPIAISILIGAYMLYKIAEELEEIAMSLKK